MQTFSATREKRGRRRAGGIVGVLACRCDQFPGGKLLLLVDMRWGFRQCKRRERVRRLGANR